MLTEAQRDRIEIVLVSPRNPLNIGAAARAMANFGFARLTVVAPYEPHWREARSAIQAENLLESARCTETVAEAVADCTLIAGTGTVGPRVPEQPVVQLPSFAALAHAELARGGRIAVVFGPEKHGLTRDDLSYSHVLLEIPTHPSQPSMNLGQAVAVVLYELTRTEPPEIGPPISPALSAPVLSAPALSNMTDASEPPTTSAQLEALAELVEQTMAAVNYSPAAVRRANRHDLRLMLRRVSPAAKDLRRTFGLFRRILWRLGRGPHDKVPD